MQTRCLSPATIKTDLAAIRFWHDQIPNVRYSLPSNHEYKLERRHFGGVDRTWSNAEFNRMLAECLKANREDFAACIVIARYASLRLHEVLRIDTALARSSLKTGLLTVKGKGGKERTVSINDTIRIEFENFLKFTPPRQKLFVPKGRQTHLVKAELQGFIAAHRKDILDEADERPLTFHGLRHTCAAEQYDKLLAEGKTDKAARQQVTKLLGHEREDVTRVYIGRRPNK